jgi:hypothetical protein
MQKREVRKQYPLRLTDSERAAFQKAARDASLTLADWIRTRCLAAVKREKRARKKDG